MAVARIAAPLRQQVIAQLRDDITSMEFAPGSRLVERDLCERYEVSRTVVREALRQLEAEGIVTTIANRGPVVAELSFDEAVALFEVREILEPAICRLFTERADDERRRRLRAAMADFEASMGTGNVADELRSKDVYYDVLLDGSGNPVLNSLFRTLLARIRLLRGLSLSATGRSRQTLTELKKIAKAIDARDPDRVSQLAHEHVLAARAAAFAQMKAEEEAARAAAVGS